MPFVSIRVVCKSLLPMLKLVVIGNGMAGMRTVEELLSAEPDKYTITVFGSEPYGNYNRIMLSSCSHQYYLVKKRLKIFLSIAINGIATTQ